MHKDQYTAAFRAISDIEELFQQADALFVTVPPQIQQAILEYHTSNATLQHCLRWGLTAAGDIRMDWHTVVSKLEVDGG